MQLWYSCALRSTLNAVNLTFITFSRFLQSLDGVLFAFFVIAVAAAEAAVGLAIFVMIYRSREYNQCG